MLRKPLSVFVYVIRGKFCIIMLFQTPTEIFVLFLLGNFFLSPRGGGDIFVVL